MLQLSTPSTSFFYIRPRSFPMIMFAFLAYFDVMWIVDTHANPRAPLWQGIWVPLLVSIVGYVGIKTLKSLTYDDVDEVWLEGDALIIKNRGLVSHVALADVTDAVDATVHSTVGRPLPRIRLTLRSGSSNLGDSISFLAGGAPGPFGKLDLKSILAMLERRIDEGHQNSG